jgi:hypothetical protein
MTKILLINIEKRYGDSATMKTLLLILLFILVPFYVFANEAWLKLEGGLGVSYSRANIENNYIRETVIGDLEWEETSWALPLDIGIEPVWKLNENWGIGGVVRVNDLLQNVRNGKPEQEVAGSKTWEGDCGGGSVYTWWWPIVLRKDRMSYGTSLYYFETPEKNHRDYMFYGLRFLVQEYSLYAETDLESSRLTLRNGIGSRLEFAWGEVDHNMTPEFFCYCEVFGEVKTIGIGLRLGRYFDLYDW